MTTGSPGARPNDITHLPPTGSVTMIVLRDDLYIMSMLPRLS